MFYSLGFELQAAPITDLINPQLSNIVSEVGLLSKNPTKETVKCFYV